MSARGRVWAFPKAIDPPALQRNFPRVVQAIHGSRIWAREVAISSGHGRQAPTIELLVSELATNAVRYGKGEVFSVEFYASLLVAVRDAGTEMLPQLSYADYSQEVGRGLPILEALAARWGSDMNPDGLRVWFQLDE